MTATALLAALTLAAAPAAAAAPRPIQLVTEATGNQVRMRVLGSSPVACDTAYLLEVTNRSAAGSNRSVQRGTARLRPGVPIGLATLTLGANQKSWTARLTVDPCGPAPAYTEVRNAPL